MATERATVRYGDSTIEYQVRRSQRRRKTVQVTVDGGEVQVAAPAATPESELRAIVRRRAPWILNHLNEEASTSPPKKFVSGETLPYLGRNVRLIVETRDLRKPEIRFDHWRFRLSIPEDIVEEERYQRSRSAVTEWYRARAEVRLRAAVRRWWHRWSQGGEPRILVRDQRKRWGSCAPDGTLRFNWRLVMLTPALMEYVVVHELAHLKVNNHSGAFWREVRSVLPDVEHRRRGLREAGKTLPTW